MNFEVFVGIDWSGAAGSWQHGLQVAVAFPGRAAPRLLEGRGPRGLWSRDGVVRWLGEACGRGRALIGLDFAFGFPSLPGVDDVGGAALWQEIDELCRADDNLYGGQFFTSGDHRLGAHVFSRRIKGALFDRGRQRATERAAAQVAGATPSSPLHAIGPAQVGPSSVSGMRALHRLATASGARPVIWPFAGDDGRSSVLVEVFPRYFPLSRGCRPRMADPALLDLALAAFRSEPAVAAPRNEDEGDALVTAAALRALGAPSSPAELPSAALREGWIFGVAPPP